MGDTTMSTDLTTTSACLRAVRDHIDYHGPEKFNLEAWATDDEGETYDLTAIDSWTFHNCGTVGCLAGHAAAVLRPVLEDDLDEIEILGEIGELLGLNHGHFLSTPSWMPQATYNLWLDADDRDRPRVEHAAVLDLLNERIRIEDERNQP